MLRVSAVTTAGEQLAPLLLQAFRAHRPEFEVSLDVGNRETVFARLGEHAVDVAITGRVPERFHGERFADNEIVLITAAEDPLARRRWVAIDELAERPWLVRELGSGTRAMCQEYLAGHELSPELLTFGSNGAIRQAVRAGLGVALISRAAVELELEHRVLGVIRVRGGLPERSWYLARSKAGPVSDAVTQFSAFVHSDAARRVLSA
jgi:DNA-binding transcriptional LysR family regulator